MTNGFDENYRDESPFNLHYLKTEIKEDSAISEFETPNRAQEEATVRTEFLNGNEDPKSLTNIIFFGRHRGRNNEPIKQHEKKEAREWIDIRDKIVRPIIESLKKKNQSTPGSTSDKDKGNIFGTPKLSSINDFILSRLNNFQYKSYAELLSVSLNRLKNPWHTDYTSDVIQNAAVISLIKYIYTNPPTPNDIVIKLRSLLDQKKFALSAHILNEPPEVFPVYELRTGWNQVELLINPNSQLNKNGKNLYTSCALGGFLDSAFKYTLERWNNIKPILSAMEIPNHGLRPERIQYIVNDPHFRRHTIEIAKKHKSASKLIKIFYADPNLSTSKRHPTNVDFENIQDKEWALILLQLTLIADRENRKTLTDLKIRREKHFINEAWRPHLIQLGPVDAISFMHKTYDQNSFAILNYNNIKVEAGQRLINASGHTLFLLACSSDGVIYQNEQDKMFYKQSLAGIGEELRYQIYGMIAQKAQYIIHLIKFPIGLITAVFPVARWVYLAANVLNTTNRFYYHWNEFETLYKNMKISVNNIEKIVPGMLLAVLLIAKAGATKMLDPKQMELPLDQWLKAILQISMTLVEKYYQGKIFSGTAVTVLAKIWDSIKSVLRILYTILSNSVIPYVTGVMGRKDDKNIENNIADLGRKLAETGLKNSMHYARMLLALHAPTADSLVREVIEVERNGTEFINLATKCTSM